MATSAAFKARHFARLTADKRNPEPRAACGVNMFPDTGDRPNWTHVHHGVTCMACQRTKVFKSTPRDASLPTK